MYWFFLCYFVMYAVVFFRLKNLAQSAMKEAIEDIEDLIKSFRKKEDTGNPSVQKRLYILQKALNVAKTKGRLKITLHSAVHSMYAVPFVIIADTFESEDFVASLKASFKSRFKRGLLEQFALGVIEDAK